MAEKSLRPRLIRRQVAIPEPAFERLLDIAKSERRLISDQASIMLEWAIGVWQTPIQPSSSHPGE